MRDPDEMYSLQGRTALVTGASRGVGWAIALRMTTLGATVIVTGRNETQLGSTVHEIETAGGTGVQLATDLSSLDSCQSLARSVTSEVGTLDVLVNNAGGSTVRKIRGTDAR